MDRKARNLLVLAGVLVVLVIGYALVALLTPEEDTTSTDSSSDTPVYLFRLSEDGMTALSFTHDADGDGEAESWVFTRSGEDWHWSQDASVPLGVAAFNTIADTLSDATGTLLSTAVPPERLADYGLDAPRKKVTFTDAAGGAQSFCIGAYNAYNGTYCITLGGDETTVYMVDAELVTLFDLSIEDMVYVDDLPSCEAEDLVSVTFTTPDRVIAVTHETVEIDGMEGLAWFRSVDGAASVRVSDTLAERIDTLLGDMDYLDCLSVTTADHPTYGLDQATTTMTVVYEKTVGGTLIEKTFTLTLGSTDSYDYYYVNPANTPVTMLLGGAIWHQLITYDDDRIATDGDVQSSDTTVDTTA